MRRLLPPLLLLACLPAHATTGLQIKPRLGDRFFVDSVLQKVFGEGARKVSEKFILSSAYVFGGPCDRYERAPNGSYSSCEGGAVSLPSVGTSNVVRQGYVARACQALSFAPVTRDFALQQAFAAKSDSNSLDLPHMQALYRLFNPQMEIPAAAVEKLKKLAATETEEKKQWATVLYAICLDSSWQNI